MKHSIDEQSWTRFAADYGLGHNPFRSCSRVWRDLIVHSWQIWMIFKSGFTATFRQTVFGQLWGVIMPLVPLFAFFILTLLRIFPAHESIPPLSYMAVGVTLWLYLQGLMVAPAEAVTKHASVLKSSDFPMVCVFMASYGRLAFEMLIRILVVAPILVFFYEISLAGLALVPLLLLPASAFGIAFGIFLGLGGIVVQDLKNVMEIILRYLIFISFAIFPLSMSGVGGWFYSLNPLAIYIDNIRNVLITGHLATPGHFYVVSLISIVLLVLALHLYSVLERRVAGAL